MEQILSWESPLQILKEKILGGNFYLYIYFRGPNPSSDPKVLCPCISFHFQWRQTLIFIGGALSTFVENQPFVCDYWWCKIYFYTLNSRIIGGAAAPGALQVWRHWILH